MDWVFKTKGVLHRFGKRLTKREIWRAHVGAGARHFDFTLIT